MEIRVVEFTPCRSNTLQGFVTVEFIELGLVILGFAVHQKGESRWLELPAKPPTNPENSAWIKVVTFYDRRKENEFKKMVLDNFDGSLELLIDK